MCIRDSDVGGGLHGLQLGLADHAERLRRAGHVNGQEVSAGDQLVELDQLSTELRGARGGDVGVVGQQFDTEAAQTLGDKRADAAETDDACLLYTSRCV